MDGYAVRAADAARGAAGRRRIVRRRRPGAARAAHGHDDRDRRAAARGRRRRRAGGARARRRRSRLLRRARSSSGDHVRPRGTDVPAGAVVISAGSRLRPLALAAIATSGVAELRCHRAPRVCVVVTGDELVAPGKPLLHGQIHESNSILIAARCEQAGARRRRPSSACATTPRRRARRSPGRSRRPTSSSPPAACRSARAITSSRRSPRSASSSCSGGSPCSPAGPTWCGLRDGRVVIGLPGNPLSVMVGLELLLLPALRRLAGAADPGPAHFRLPLTSALRRDPQRLRVRPVRIAADGAEPLGADLSHQLGRAADRRCPRARARRRAASSPPARRRADRPPDAARRYAAAVADEAGAMRTRRGSRPASLTLSSRAKTRSGGSAL